MVLPNDASRRLLGADFARVVGRPLREAWPDELGHQRARPPRDARDRPAPGGGGRPLHRPSPGDVPHLRPHRPAGRPGRAWPAPCRPPSTPPTASSAGARTPCSTGWRPTSAGAATVAEAAERAVAIIGSDPGLVPFALVYVLDGTRTRAQLTASTGLPPGTSAAPRTVALADDDAVWPLDTAARFASPTVVDDLADRLPGLRAGPYPEPPPGALVLPLRLAHDERPAGVLVLGLSARRPLDAGYRAFLDQVGARMAAGLTGARARQQERGRQEALADARPGQDRVLRQRQPRVPHPAHPPPRTPRSGPRRPARPRPRRRRRPRARPPGRPPPAADGAVPARLLPGRDRPPAGDVRAHRPVRPHPGAGGRLPRARPTPPGCGWWSTARRCPSRCGSTGSCGSGSCPTCSPTPSSSRSRGHVTVTLRLLPSHAELVVADTGVGIPEVGGGPRLRALPPGGGRAGPDPGGHRDRARPWSTTWSGSTTGGCGCAAGWARARRSPCGCPGAHGPTPAPAAPARHRGRRAPPPPHRHRRAGPAEPGPRPTPTRPSGGRPTPSPPRSTPAPSGPRARWPPGPASSWSTTTPTCAPT